MDKRSLQLYIIPTMEDRSSDSFFGSCSAFNPIEVTSFGMANRANVSSSNKISLLLAQFCNFSP